MSVAQNEHGAPCRFREQHPTGARPASRLPLIPGAVHARAGAWCMATRRGLRASSRPRLRDARRPASRVSPARRS